MSNLSPVSNCTLQGMLLNASERCLRQNPNSGSNCRILSSHHSMRLFNNHRLPRFEKSSAVTATTSRRHLKSVCLPTEYVGTKSPQNRAMFAIQIPQFSKDDYSSRSGTKPSIPVACQDCHTSARVFVNKLMPGMRS